MKYILEVTGNNCNKEFEDEEVQVTINRDEVSTREDASVIFKLPNGKEWWIPVVELDKLLGNVR